MNYIQDSFYYLLPYKKYPGENRETQYETIAYYSKEKFLPYAKNPNYLIGDYGTIIDIENQCKVVPSLNSKEDEHGNPINPNSYLTFRFAVNAAKKQEDPKYVHKVIMETFSPVQYYETMQCSHLNRCNYDNKLTNLRWKTTRNTPIPKYDLSDSNIIDMIKNAKGLTRQIVNNLVVYEYRNMPIYEDEIFKYYPKNPDYIVGNYGTIYDSRYRHKLVPYTNWRKDGGKNYAHVSIRVLDRKKSFTIGVHRMVMQTFEPLEDDSNMEVNHINGELTLFNHWDPDKSKSNLEWVTPQENIQHAIRTGLVPIGENKSGAKFTDAEVHEFCRLMRDEGKSPTEICIIYNRYGDKNFLHYLSDLRLHKKRKNITCQYEFPDPPKHTEESVERIYTLACDGKYNSNEIAIMVEKEFHIPTTKAFVDELKSYDYYEKRGHTIWSPLFHKYKDKIVKRNPNSKYKNAPKQIIYIEPQTQVRNKYASARRVTFTICPDDPSKNTIVIDRDS